MNFDRTLQAFWKDSRCASSGSWQRWSSLSVSTWSWGAEARSSTHCRRAEARNLSIAAAVGAELASLVCYAALVRVLALLSLTVIGIAMVDSLPGGQAISTRGAHKRGSG
jgi:hypothetical protein